jgi:putative addiction module component (TIGR02574 family)
MPTSLQHILEQARELSAEDRAKLINSLLESLGPPLPGIEKAWAEEIEQRISAFDRGEIAAYTAEDVFADARRISR